MTPSRKHCEPFGVAIIDRNCRYVYVNETLAAYHGHSKEEYLDKHISELIPPTAFTVVAPLYQYVLATGLCVDRVDFYCNEENDNVTEVRHWRASYHPVEQGVRAIVFDLKAPSCKEQNIATSLVIVANQISALSRTELIILQLLGKGQSTKDIATNIGVSNLTVATHRKHICKKLNIHSTPELIALATAIT